MLHNPSDNFELGRRLRVTEGFSANINTKSTFFFSQAPPISCHRQSDHLVAGNSSYHISWSSENNY